MPEPCSSASWPERQQVRLKTRIAEVSRFWLLGTDEVECPPTEAAERVFLLIASHFEPVGDRDVDLDHLEKEEASASGGASRAVTGAVRVCPYERQCDTTVGNWQSQLSTEYDILSALRFRI